MPGAMIRYGTSFCLAVLVTFGLFFLMQYLIAKGEASIDEVEKVRVIDFVRLRRDSIIEPKKRELPQKPQAGDQPLAPQINMSAPTALAAGTPVMSIAAPKPDIDFKFRSGPQLGPAPTSDADEIPLVRVEPQYPRLAAQDRIEGWVRVRFDIDRLGRVRNPVVVAAQPPHVFEGAALRAIEKWRYRPKMRNGVAVERKGIQVKLSFKLID